MDKTNIRINLKHNFLKTLIIRVDFSGLMDTDVEDFIKVIRPSLIERKYITFQEEYSNNNENRGLNSDNLQASNEMAKVYVFNSRMGKEIRLSKTFITFEINIEKNETYFSSYIDLISYVLDELKKIPYIQFFRIGLRKVNVCILLNKKNVNKYFKDAVMCRFRDDSPITHVADEFFIEDYRVNYNRQFQEGKIMENGEEKTGYQIILDVNSFIEDYVMVNEQITKIESKKILTKLNDIVYDIYISSLTDEFITNLSKEVYNENEIRGVMKNG